jgi:hypothetical protein
VDVVQVPVQPLAARVAGVKRRKVRKLVRRLMNFILLMLFDVLVCEVEVWILRFCFKVNTFSSIIPATDFSLTSMSLVLYLYVAERRGALERCVEEKVVSRRRSSS